MITYTAFITTEDDDAADPGLLVQVNDEQDGQSDYKGDAARIDSPDFPLADEFGGLDMAAAGKILALAGYQLADGEWRHGGGQWTAMVERA